MKLITGIRFNVIFSLVILTISLSLAIKLDKSHLFARAGALIVLSGILLTTRELLIRNSEETIEKAKRSIFYEAPHVDDPNASKIHNAQEVEIRDIVYSAKLGFYFLVFGTVIWAYGDLILEFIYL